MKKLHDILEKLDQFLASINAPSLDALRPGIERDNIESLVAELGLPFIEEFYELYTWRNGILETDKRLIGEMTLFTNGILYSLDEAVDIYRYYTVENNFWNRKYFPLFSSGGGDFLLLNLGGGKSQGMLFLYSPILLYSNEPVSIYDSLESLFLSVLECYQKNAFYFENRMLEKNIDLEFSICKKNNPYSEYWKDAQ